MYRRADLTQWSNAVDRHLNELVKSGYLEKLSVGLYYAPKKSIFGVVPPEDESLVRTFLKEDDFLITSPNAYNSLGVGTTQLYNVRVVYNHKRHGEFDLGGRKFFFHAKHRFPKKLTQEFLLVDLVNNIENLAEDKTEVLTKVLAKAKTMDARQLRRTVTSYGNTKAKSLFSSLITQKNNVAYAR
ncbi:hypothetical protein CJD36_021175 [Flavipsychrobacter stenotrophus]|uniref:Transcriptional regulator, AbiEi antitoxin, Type IV TA system n=1 Tax=Flavipsychrobacter stenotrophus TaxID=2077091 RepID=A0A2S7SQV2_9BACT|nr:hypothetical protein CJD36_021175 [Flavipsychrobacter stenotrophus]